MENLSMEDENNIKLPDLVTSGIRNVNLEPDESCQNIQMGINNMVMITMSSEDYEEEYWPKLEAAIHQLLTLSPGEYVPISYEQMYTCVYKCVCKHFSERLYSDLHSLIKNHLQQISMELHQVNPSVYILKFNAAMNQYFQALGGIVPIFNYMNRFYVENKLHSDLRTELLRIFTLAVAENHIEKIIALLDEAQTKPFSIMPSIMANIVKGLYSLKPEFSLLCPQLFMKFIPNLSPPMNESDLPTYIQATQQEQQQLLREGFPRGNQSLKRPGDALSPKEEEAYNKVDTENALNQTILNPAAEEKKERK